MSTSTLTSKGQVTVPKQIRDLLQLKKGQKLDFQVLDQSRVILRAANQDVRQMKGFFKAPGGKRTAVRDINRTIAEGYADVSPLPGAQRKAAPASAHPVRAPRSPAREA